MPMLHNSGSTFDTDAATHIYSPGTQQLQANKMASTGVDPSTGKDYVFYSFDDVYGLPAGFEIINDTNFDGFNLNASYDYEIIIYGDFYTTGGDPNQTYDVRFFRWNGPGNPGVTLATFTSPSTSLSFRRYIATNQDGYEQTKNQYGWTVENVNWDYVNYSVAPVYGNWGAYVIPARREITGNV